MALKPRKRVTDEREAELPESNLVAIIDMDAPKYSASGVGEKRTIVVTHIKSTKTKEFSNRTEFWGRSSKVIGGWLGEQNKEREEMGLTPFTKDDFTIEDVQEPEPLENLLHTAKSMVYSSLEALGTNKYEAYLGEGASFRVGMSTLMEYKGNRKDTLRPVYLDEVTDYLTHKFKPTIVSGIEADDAVVIRAYNDPNAVILGVDKDYRGQPVKFFDINNPDEGIINGDCFGELVDKGNKVTGYGRIFLYQQILSGDSSDNYKANCHSTKKWGEKSAYKALVKCKDDKEALQVLIDCFKELYPEPKKIESWTGNEIVIDWYYVVNELFQMARMMRWNGDIMTFDSWCNSYGVKW